MVKVMFNHERKEWEKLADYSPEGIYLHIKIKEKLDRIKDIQKKNWDCMFIICGIEGGGKSTLGKLCLWYLSDTSATINNIAADAKEAFDKLKNLPDESPLLIDEGELMFGSKDAMRSEQRQLIKILQVIRQKRMVLIIVSPEFFDLNKYLAVHRSRFLLRAVTDKKLRRGHFQYWGEKKKRLLYEIGKRNFNSYSNPKREWAGDFADFKLPFEDEYEQTKKKSLASSFEEQKKGIDVKEYYALMRLKATQALEANKKLKTPLTQKQIASVLGVSSGFLGDIAKEKGLSNPIRKPYIEYKWNNPKDMPENWEEFDADGTITNDLDKETEP